MGSSLPENEPAKFRRKQGLLPAADVDGDGERTGGIAVSHQRLDGVVRGSSCVTGHVRGGCGMSRRPRHRADHCIVGLASGGMCCRRCCTHIADRAGTAHPCTRGIERSADARVTAVPLIEQRHGHFRAGHRPCDKRPLLFRCHQLIHVPS